MSHVRNTRPADLLAIPGGIFCCSSVVSRCPLPLPWVVGSLWVCWLLYVQFSLVWLLHCLLGVGVLFAWNAWITPFAYFTNLYPKLPFEFLLSIIFNYATVSFLFVNIKVGPRIPLLFRLNFGFVLNAAVMAFVPFVPHIGMTTNAAFGLTMALAFVTGNE